VAVVEEAVAVVVGPAKVMVLQEMLVVVQLEVEVVLEVLEHKMVLLVP
jgi:hypothetical protein